MGKKTIECPECHKQIDHLLKTYSCTQAVYVEGFDEDEDYHDRITEDNYYCPECKAEFSLSEVVEDENGDLKIEG